MISSKSGSKLRQSDIGLAYFYPERRDFMFLRNVSTHIPGYKWSSFLVHYNAVSNSANSLHSCSTSPKCCIEKKKQVMVNTCSILM